MANIPVPNISQVLNGDNFKHYIKFRVEPEIKEAIIFNYEAIVQYRANVVDCINYFNNNLNEALTIYRENKLIDDKIFNYFLKLPLSTTGLHERKK